MRDLASIQKIESLTPIDGKDKIELARIQGWDVIVQKGAFKVGDLVVYVQYDTVLPDKPEFEFLRKRCWNSRYNGHRIRNMSMGGVFSQGIVFPLDILPAGTYKEGQNVTNIIGVVRYAPEEFVSQTPPNSKQPPIYRLLMRYTWFRKLFGGTWKEKKGKFPENIKKTDEGNVQVVFGRMPKDHTWTITEKIEGQSVTLSVESIKIGFFKKRDYKVFSRNTFVGEGNSNWGYISKKYNLRKKLLSEKTNYTIQGEIAGPGIQKNIYDFGDKELFVFSIIETDTGKKLDYTEMKSLCNKWGVSIVPVLTEHYTLPKTSDGIVKMSNGITVVGNRKGQKREGVVLRSEQDPNLSFKARSPEYLMWWDKKDK